MLEIVEMVTNSPSHYTLPLLKEKEKRMEKLDNVILDNPIKVQRHQSWNICD